MDSESDELLGVLFGQQDEMFSSASFPSSDGGTFPLSEHVYRAAADKLFQEWAIHEKQALKDREDEDLHLMINPNDVYRSGTPSESPESDSGISDDHRMDSPQHSETSQSERPSAPLYEVIYNIGALGNIKTEPVQSNVVSIQLDDWSTPILVPEPRAVHELITHHTPALSKVNMLPLMMNAAELQAVEALYPELMLTDEEKRLLSQEGVALPNNMPLTKAEERILKKVRRKIRNKQSAQDSRRRKKEYIDGLESRVAACSAQNQELHKKVLELEKHNVSLLTQLRRLQSLIKQTSTKAAQTSTCILIFVCSLGLLVFPSYSPFRSDSALSREEYRPTGVISRNILNELEVPEPLDVPAPETTPPAIHPPDEEERLGPMEAAQLLTPQEDQRDPAPVRSVQAPEEEPGLVGKAANTSALLHAGESEPNGVRDTDTPLPKGASPDTDLVKPKHADEM